MESLLPITVHLAFWINAKFGGRISDSDYANACETLIGYSLPLPTRRAQSNLTDCALDSHHILRADVNGKWQIIQRENSLTALDPAAAKQALLAELANGVVTLNSLPTLGSRSEIDDSLNQQAFPHLPSLSPKTRESLDLALRIRLVCVQARETVQVPSSPSSADLTRNFLREIDTLALSLICALASNA